MIVTKELLEKYNACDEGKLRILDKYPNGVELITLIENEDLPQEMLYFGEKYFPYNQEELAALHKKTNVVNSNGVKYSHDVLNSSFVHKSFNIKDSERIFYSKAVKNSKNILKSAKVKASEDIINCEDIVDSKLCKNSGTIVKSSDIYNSQNVKECEHIASSQAVSYSKHIYSSTRVSHSDYCAFSENLQNCMFCSGMKDKEYYIFNTQVDPQTFFEAQNILHEYEKQYLTDNQNLLKYSGELITKTEYLSYEFSLFKNLLELPPEVLNLIRKFPNFDESFFIQKI